MTPSRLVLLDRDGVLNADCPEGVLRREDIHLLPGAAEGVALLSHAGFQVAVVTNQSALAKGTLTPETLEAIHADLCAQIAQAGGRIDRIYVCGDHPERPGPRRKPAPGMLREALADFGAEAAATPMIGDMLRDLQAATKAGCPRYLVKTGKGETTLAAGLPQEVQPVSICATLLDAARRIVGMNG